MGTQLNLMNIPQSMAMRFARNGMAYSAARIAGN
jgi:hypothetical protein